MPLSKKTRTKTRAANKADRPGRLKNQVRNPAHSAREHREEILRLHLELETLEDRLLLSSTPVLIGHHSPAEIIEVDGHAYFGTSNLFRTDGTEAGTEQIADWNPGGKSGPFHLTNLNGTIFFVQPDALSGYELRTSNGQPGGSVLVKDISPGTANTRIRDIVATDNLIYFTSEGDSTGTTSGFELWRSDGTAAGTFMLKDIGGSTDSDLHDLTAVGNQLFFVADDGVHGRELWASNGTTAGTRMVKDINPGSAHSSPGGRSIAGSQMKEFNGRLLFAATTDTNSRELWRSDGTAGGTQLVADLNFSNSSLIGSSSPNNIVEWNGAAYFSAQGRVGAGVTTGVWKTNGISGATLVKGGFNFGFNVSGPSNFTVTNNQIFFMASHTPEGRNLWRTDGTTGGTRIVKDFNPGEAFRDAVYDMTAVGEKLFFRLNDSSQPAGIEIWESNGTAAGTKLAFDHNPGPGSFFPSTLRNISGSLYFTARLNPNPFVGASLFRYTDPIVVSGTGGADTFAATISSSNIAVKVNGGATANYPISDTGGIEFRGSGGTDRIVITGTSGAETATLRRGTLVYNGRGYALTTSSIENARVNGNSKDTAIFRDSSGNDTFTGKPSSSKMTGSGYQNLAVGFGTVTAVASSGGNDRANLFDNSGNNRFDSRDDRASLTGSGLRFNTFGFESVYAYASTGNDTSVFKDSSGNDRFYGFKTNSLMAGSGFYNRAYGFDRNHATSSGGNDLAFLYDSSGNDRFYGYQDRALLFGSGFYNQAIGFSRAFGYASGGNDIAFLRDSSGNDRFTGYHNQAILSGSGFDNRARGFDRVYGYASSGTDIAFLYDSSGNDRFYGRATVSFLFGSGFYNSASRFDRVFAYSSRGTDNAYLFDSNGNDRLTARATTSELSGSGFFYRATGFKNDYAYASGGNDTANFFDSSRNDEFRGYSTYAQMTVMSTLNRAYGFDRSNAYASRGNDTARVFGGPRNDKFVGRGSTGALSGSGFYNFVKSFDTVHANARQGGTDTLDVGRVTYRLISNGWER